MSVQIGDIFYFGITYDGYFDYFDFERKSEYIDKFIEVEKEFEYKVELIEIRHDDPDKKYLCYKLKILEMLTHKDKFNQNKVGDYVYAYDLKKDCVLTSYKLSVRPNCGINDGGRINCSGCYYSLVIPWSLYLEYIAINKYLNTPVQILIKDKAIRIEYNNDDLMLDLVPKNKMFTLTIHKKKDELGYLTDDGNFIEFSTYEYTAIALFFADYLIMT
jgi:hypothetical protein